MSGKQTAKNAVEILVGARLGFRVLKPIEKTNLLVAFARKNKVVYGDAFDLVKCPPSLSLTEEAEVTRNLHSVVLYEVKSTDRERLPQDFAGYFFDLTTAELLTAQSLQDQYKFAFVNIKTMEYREMTIKQVYERAKSIYPKWAVRF